MTLNREAIEKFKQLYVSEYGVVLSDSTALELGYKLVAFVGAVYANHGELIDNSIREEHNRLVLKYFGGDF